MQDLKRAWRRCKKRHQRQARSLPKDKLFTLSLNEFTQPPIVVPYLVHGHGTLKNLRLQANPRESDRADGGRDRVIAAIPRPPIHYFRFRRWMRKGDPCQLSGGIGDRGRIASRILADEMGERRRDNREIWQKLLCYPETHVVRLGWQSQINGINHDILYIPLTFDEEELAKDFGDYLVYHLQKESSLRVLCPSVSNFYDVQVYWLTVAFWHLRWRLLTPSKGR